MILVRAVIDPDPILGTVGARRDKKLEEIYDNMERKQTVMRV